MAATLKSTDDDAVGILVRYQDENNHYRFTWDQQRSFRKLMKIENGTFTVLAEDAVPYVQGQNYTAQVRADGSQLTVWIDGVQILTATDATFTTGTVALYSRGNSGAHFDDVLVQSLGTGGSSGGGSGGGSGGSSGGGTMQTTLFVYDGDGGRVKKVTDTVTTRYIGKLFECDNSSCARFIFAGSQRIAVVPSTGGTYYYHQNHLGSSSVITDATGAQVQNLTYFPYGGTHTNVPGTPVDVPYKYTGKELDATTGLYFYEARYHDPVLGRFLSADTIVPNPRDPQSLNRYSYARNNPIMFNDPSGHFFKSIVKAFRSVVKRIGKVIKDNIVLRVAAWTFAPGFTMNLDPDSQPYVVQGGAIAIGFAVAGPVGVKAGGGLTGIILGSTVGGAASGGARAGINNALGYKEKENVGLAIASGAASGLVSAGGFSAGAMTGNTWGLAAGALAGNVGGAVVSAAVVGGDPGKAAIRALIQTAAVTGIAIGVKLVDGFGNYGDLRSNFDSTQGHHGCISATPCVVGGDLKFNPKTNSYDLSVDLLKGHAGPADIEVIARPSVNFLGSTTYSLDENFLTVLSDITGPRVFPGIPPPPPLIFYGGARSVRDGYIHLRGPNNSVFQIPGYHSRQ